MIKRFQVIKGVGIFYDYSAKGDGLDLKKNSIILANNGYGKTTISAILRSLKYDNTNIISGRRTLGKNIPQEIVIKTDSGKSICYQNQKWQSDDTSIADRLEIFDKRFVEDNLYTSHVTTDHRNQLYRIILGEDGLKLADELETIKSEEKNLKKYLKEMEKELKKKKQLVGGFDYINLIKEFNKSQVDLKIKELEKDMGNKTKENEIRSMERPNEIKLRVGDFDKLQEIFSFTLNQQHKEATNKIREHIWKNFRNTGNAEWFIREGMTQIKDSCPFCGQSMDKAQQLLDTYKLYFNKIYKDKLGLMETKYNSFKNWNVQAELINVIKELNKNKITLERWNRVLKDQLIINDVEGELNAYIQKAGDLKIDLEMDLEKKKNNLYEQISFSNLQKLKNLFFEVKKKINNYNNEIKKLNSNINYYINQLTKIDSHKLRKDHIIWQNINQRFS